jgi:hypothetical protein
MKTTNLFYVPMIILSSILVSFTPNVNEHGNAVIGTMVDGVPKITMEESLMKSNWEAALSLGGLEVNLALFQIVQTGDNTYLLMSANEERDIVVCISLVLDNDVFYEELFASGRGLTVACSGCAIGCQPEIIAGKGSCLNFCTTCTKTSTLTQGAILTN